MNNSSNIASNASLNNASLFELHYSSLIIFMVIILTINFSGAVANGIIFIATMTYRPLHRSSSSLLLAHCILLDFFTTICVEPGLVLVTYFGSVAPLPKNFCHGFGLLIFVPLFANNWTHATLAINRFIAAAFPHRYKYFVTRPALITAVTFPWLVSGMLNLFPIAQITVRYELARGWRSCTLGAAGSTTRNVLLALGLYFPCLVIGLCYSIVLIKARISIRRREGDNTRHVALRKRHEASKMLFICFIWYCISNFCVPTANSFFSAAYIASPLTQLGLGGLQYISSAVNPVFFIAVSRNYQEGSVAVIKCRICRRKRSEIGMRLLNQGRVRPRFGAGTNENRVSQLPSPPISDDPRRHQTIHQETARM